MVVIKSKSNRPTGLPLWLLEAMAIQDPDDTKAHRLPERLRVARYKVFDEVMPTEWLGQAGMWLHANRGLFRRGGDEDGLSRFGYELANLDAMYKPVAELRKEIIARLDEAIESLGLEDFELDHIETHATLYHHGGTFMWHKDVESETTRRLAFAFYLSAVPKMFSGGELEFLDGASVEPETNRLVVYPADQQHRVRPVECWSAEFLHGRWAIVGWLHSEAV
jgi:Rps23 Pro-64 3,4-dihydroxylase Tpa1-like proline 4-hydroxylase